MHTLVGLLRYTGRARFHMRALRFTGIRKERTVVRSAGTASRRFPSYRMAL